MEPLPFDSPAKTDVVRRFLTSAKIFVSTSVGTRTETSRTAIALSSHLATDVPCNSKVMLLGGEEGLTCEVCVDGIRLEHVSEFKYLRCDLDESGKDVAECSRKMASGRMVEHVIRALVNAWSCSLSVLWSCMSHWWCLFLRMVVRQ